MKTKLIKAETSIARHPSRNQGVSAGSIFPVHHLQPPTPKVSGQ
ncbi:hypothetical protein Z948_900 [Sulfitobacter donghicola DSW-25 = KCTC 12864 = JCM 14565]|nr:hypothetical protein Z948_900 [Sulfitobacter donghicola DSW-25 = KCTC 12864 = JCM 14565]